MLKVNIARRVVAFFIVTLTGLFSPVAFAQRDVLDTFLGIGATIILNQIERGDQGTAGRSVKSDDSQADETILAVQQRLNALGFASGTPDGVAGPRTRQAIAAWQQSIGVTPTGMLKPSELDRLLYEKNGAVGQTAKAFSEGAAGDFALLDGFDLPQNDVRSGITDAGLRDITVDTCIMACRNDALCAAFTYNTSARMCFLKSANGNPVSYAGAVSGIKILASQPTIVGDVAGYPGVTGLPLSTGQIITLQNGLNTLGYDAGVADGQPGSRTKGAIGAFLADNPGVASMAIDTHLLLAVQQQIDRSAQDPAPDAGAEGTREAYLTIDELRSVFQRLAIAYHPDTFSDELALRWFQEDHGSLYLGWGRDELAERYSMANTVERQTILAEYKELVATEAFQLREELEEQGLRMRVSELARFTSFEPGRGLAFELGGPLVSRHSVFREMLFRQATQIKGIDFVGTLYDINLPTAMPLQSAQDASQFLDELRTKSRLGHAYLVVDLNIRTFGVDHNLVGTPVARDNDIPVTVEIEAITLDTWPGNEDRTVRGETLVAFPVTTKTQPPAATVQDATELAQRAGLIAVREHLLLPAGPTPISSLYGVRSYEERLSHFFGSMALGAEPRLAQGMLTDRALRALLNEQQHLQVYGRDFGRFSTFTGFGNEFERQRAQTLFDTQILPDLVSAAPRLPLSVVSVRNVVLGEYDFSSSTFPLGFHGPDELVILPDHFGDLKFKQRFVALPDRLAMNAGDAERLLSGSTARPPVYLATFGQLRISEMRELSIEVSEIGIFADIGLSQRLVALDPLEVLNQEPPSSEPSALNDMLGDYAKTSYLELARHAYAALNPLGLADGLVNLHRDVRSALPFEVEERKGRVRALLDGPLAQRIVLEGVMELGSYDEQTRLMPISYSSVSPPGGAEDGFGSSLSFDLTQEALDRLRSITTTPEAASQVSLHGLRRANWRAEVEIVDVNPDGDRGNIRFSVDIKDMVVWHITDDREAVILVHPAGSEAARAAEAEAEAAAAAIAAEATAAITAEAGRAVPALHLLDIETLDYLQLAFAPDTAPDDIYMRMMLTRLFMERRHRVPEAERFFPSGADLEDPVAREQWLLAFRQWVDRRLAALPEQLTLSIVSHPARAMCVQPLSASSDTPRAQRFFGANPHLGGLDSLDTLLSRSSGIFRTGTLLFEFNGFGLEDDDCGHASRPSPLLGELGFGERSVPSGAVLVLDQMVLPDTGRADLSSTDIAVVIKDVQTLKSKDMARAMLVIEAEYVSTTAHDDKGGTSVVTLDDLPQGVTVSDMPDGWDVVGLRPGISLEEADRLVRQHMEVAAVYVRQPGVRYLDYFDHEVSYVSAQLNEAITFAYEPTDGSHTVFAIVRRVGQQSGTMMGHQAIEALRAKYGSERQADVRETNFVMGWWSKGSPEEKSRCNVSDGDSGADWILIEGDVDTIDPGVEDHLQVRGYTVLPSPEGMVPERLDENRSDCGVAVSANKRTSGNSDHLTVLMVDYPGYAAAYQANMGLAESERHVLPDVLGGAGAIPASDLSL